MHLKVIELVIYVGRHCRRVKILYQSQPGNEPRSLNTLPRRCKSRFLPQCSRSVFINIPSDIDIKYVA